jgi:hypothetical protein
MTDSLGCGRRRHASLILWVEEGELIYVEMPAWGSHDISLDVSFYAERVHGLERLNLPLCPEGM